MSLIYKLDAFEGPLDLLLHLIDKNKVDIYDIPAALITEQYLEYLERMREADMDIMSEFLVMASRLVEIKCHMLLPGAAAEEEEEDPRSELVAQLVEYKLCRYMSDELKNMMRGAGRSLFKPSTIPAELLNVREKPDYETMLKDTTLLTLNRVFEDVMKRQEERVDPVRSRFGRIQKEDVNLEEKNEQVRLYALSHRYFSFRELLGRSRSRLEVVVTFLSILEFIRDGSFLVSQEEGRDIYITVTDRAEAAKVDETPDGGDEASEGKTPDGGDEASEGKNAGRRG